MGNDNGKIDNEKYTIERLVSDFSSENFKSEMTPDVFCKKIDQLSYLLDTETETKNRLLNYEENNQTEVVNESQKIFDCTLINIFSNLINYELPASHYKTYSKIIDIYKFYLSSCYFYCLFLSKSMDSIINLLFKIKSNIQLITQISKSIINKGIIIYFFK
jgi:hypothetical protein